ncbi:MAG: FkbM family methyltransferase [Hyphomicrobium sp.]|nr:FkbM family methyltransferase [Hyphomicrobium sp.]
MALGVGTRLERLLETVFPKTRVVFDGGHRRTLLARPVELVDVGGAMGIDPRWAPLRPGLLRVMSFDPDARSHSGMEKKAVSGDVVVPVGLAGTAGRRRLHLTSGEFASSLYPPNMDVLRSYCVAPWYAPSGEAEISVETLDAALGGTPEWSPDFVKVDVEGADLEVLKGGPSALGRAFGVQIEVSIVPRNTGAPLLPEIDAWMREQGFLPWFVMREHWVRSNLVHGATSRPQAAWADIVYFRPLAWCLDVLGTLDGEGARSAALARWIAILLVYNAHDTALELVERVRSVGLVPGSTLDALDLSVRRSVRPLGRYTLRGLAALLLSVVIAALLLLLGRRGAVLGSRLIALQAAPLFDALSRAASRAGPGGGCIADLQ